MSTIAIHSPRDEIAELSRLIGSQNGVARVLGRTAAVLSRWNRQPEKIRPRGRRLLSDALAVTSKVADVYGVEEPLESVLVTPRPELDYLLPAELIQGGRAGELLERLDQLAGVQTVVIPAAAADWKVSARAELDESLRARNEGEPLHESFVFLAVLDADEREAFAAAATQALSDARSEEKFRAFLEPYWRHLASSRLEASVATIEPDPDDEPPLSEAFSIDDLLIPDGGMTSRRFSGR